MHAAEGRLEVGREVCGTRSGPDERRVGHGQLAGLPSGAGGVQLSQDVHGAAEVSVVLRGAAAEVHASELSPLHQDHLGVGALGGERLDQAELSAICRGVEAREECFKSVLLHSGERGII